MKDFVSIRGKSKDVGFEEAILKGLPDDGGLFIPKQLPTVSYEQLKSWKNLNYVDLAKELIRLLIPVEVISTSELHQIIDKSFSTFFSDHIIPHYHIDTYPGIIVQELYHGPTLSFKDIAMGFVVNLFDYFLRKKNLHKNLMVATSGDTGPAAAYACIGKSNLDIWLLYPPEMISEEQRRQMTTIQADNVHSIAVVNTENGSDDLDEIIRLLYDDKDFTERMNLSSVNSINWGRIMFQTVHYFYGYLQNIEKVGDPLIFSVPCGAFGNLCAGTIAQRMGLPIHSFIAANNSNGIFTKVFEKGVFARSTVISTLANAIDIAVPMNFWRYLYYQCDENPEVIDRWMREYENGSVVFTSEEHDQVIGSIKSFLVSDDAILSTILDVFKSENYLLDPHGAVAVAAAIELSKNRDNLPVVCLATAHPSKFPEVTRKALGQIPIQGLHESIQKSFDKPENYKEVSFDAAIDFFKKLN